MDYHIDVQLQLSEEELAFTALSQWWCDYMMVKTRDFLALAAVCAGLLQFVLPPFLLEESRAQEIAPGEIVVTATREEVRIDQLTQSVSVRTSESIEQRSERTPSDLLRDVPGVDVAVAGGPGAVGSAFIRGANAEHTLVLYNGIEVNNPISNVRGFNLSAFTLDNVDRVEVVRGPGSAAWGSDALGGVVNFVSKTPEPGVSSTLAVEGGNYDQVRGSATLDAADETVGVTFEASSRSTGGFSQAASYLGNKESDRFQQDSFSGRANVRADEYLTFTFFGAGQRGRLDIDNSGGPGGDDPNRIFLSDSLVGGGEANLDWYDCRVSSALGLGYSYQTFDDNNDPDEVHPLDRLRSSFTGSLVKGYSRNTIHLGERSNVLVGAEVESEAGDSYYRSLSQFGPYDDRFPRRTMSTTGLFSTSTLQVLDSLILSAGARLDDQDIFGTRETWSAGLRQNLSSGATNTALLGHIGTGYKAPSLYQLFSPYGSSDLLPEKNLGWDVGIEQGFDRLIVRTSYFENNFDNLISFDPNTFIFSNIASATTRGVEASVEYPLSAFSTLNGSYTYTDTRDGTTGLSLLRRARNKANVGLDVQPADKVHASVFVSLVGERPDLDYSTGVADRVSLGSYTLLGASARYEFAKGYEVYARLDNILDQRYEQVAGYGMWGRNGFAGLRARF